MRLPTPLSRRNPKAHKNQFGHILIIGGSPRLLGAVTLSGLAAMRCGAGLVTIGIPKSLNLTLQKKIAPVIMTLPLRETSQQTVASSAFRDLKKELTRFDAIAIGPGMSRHKSTQKFIQLIIENSAKPLVIDADALNAISGDSQILTKTKTAKILTPHPGEMARLLHLPKIEIEKHRKTYALDYAKRYRVVLLLKGHQTIIANPQGKIHINKTGNVGMATAGSGDVLTGILVALLGQGLTPFTAAQWGAHIHGLAGDLAAKEKNKISMIASDIINKIPRAINRTSSLEKMS